MPQTLLLADDSATIQRVIELTFAGEDIQVISVSDGDQAIARLQSSPPDIVLADVGMPGKNGYEVAEFVKQTPSLAHIPVVLLTGAFEPVDQVKAAAVGCAAVLAKPFEPQLVIGRVRELLGRTASADGKSPDPFAFAPAPSPAPSADFALETAPEPKVEDYFDRLDAAFATLSNPPATAAPVAAAPPPVLDELDWLRPKVVEPEAPAPQDFAIADAFAAEPEPVPEPVFAAAPAVVAEPEAIADPEPEFEAEPDVDPAPPVLASIPLAKFEPPEAIEPREPREPRVLPSIADAFTTILAAEQNALGVRPEWPVPSQSGGAPAASAAPADVVITDDLVDRVARRVLEQLSDRVVRETVASLASDVAERLVKEEIDRIKASIK